MPDKDKGKIHKYLQIGFFEIVSYMLSVCNTSCNGGRRVIFLGRKRGNYFLGHAEGNVFL